MIETVTTYKTTDGEFFESRGMAVQYQRELDRDAVLRKWVSENFGGVRVASVAEYAPDVLVIPLWQLSSFISLNGEFIEAVAKNIEKKTPERNGLLLEWREL